MTSPAAQAAERGHWKGGDLGADRVDAAGRIIGSVHKHSLGWHWTAEFELKYLGKYVDRESAEAAVIDAESRAESRTAEQGAVGELIQPTASHPNVKWYDDRPLLPVGTKLYLAPPTVAAATRAAFHTPDVRGGLEDAARRLRFHIGLNPTVSDQVVLDRIERLLADALPAEAPEGPETCTCGMGPRQSGLHFDQCPLYRAASPEAAASERVASMLGELVENVLAKHGINIQDDVRSVTRSHAALAQATTPEGVAATVCKSCGHDARAHDRQYGCGEEGCNCAKSWKEVVPESSGRNMGCQAWTDDNFGDAP